ncbi:hypothetical protein Tco_1427674 [Tanacetum coccineum]
MRETSIQLTRISLIVDWSCQLGLSVSNQGDFLFFLACLFVREAVLDFDNSVVRLSLEKRDLRRLAIPRSLSEQSLSELPSSAQPESTKKTQLFSEAVLSE